MYLHLPFHISLGEFAATFRMWSACPSVLTAIKNARLRSWLSRHLSDPSSKFGQCPQSASRIHVESFRNPLRVLFQQHSSSSGRSEGWSASVHRINPPYPVEDPGGFSDDSSAHIAPLSFILLSSPAEDTLFNVPSSALNVIFGRVS